jgi:hypothetical protein
MKVICVTPGGAAEVPHAGSCADRVCSAAHGAAAEPQGGPAAQAQGLPWTALMDASLAAAAAEAGAAPADVLAACRRVPFDAAMREVRSCRPGPALGERGPADMRVASATAGRWL